MSLPTRRPTIVHLLAEARRGREAPLESAPAELKTVPLESLKQEKKLTLLNGKPFTGIATAQWPEGTLQEEQRYLNGLKHGVYRVYNASGRLLEETPYLANLIEGISWTWHENGQMASELFAVSGVALFRRHWDDRGEQTEEYKLDENDWRYTRVLKKLEERSTD